MIELSYNLHQLMRLTKGAKNAPYEPARKLKKSTRAITGYTSVKNRQLSFESELEYDYLTLLDADPSVEAVFQQPITIQYRFDSGRWMPFTPDFFVRRFDQTSEIVEVKYLQELREKWPEFRPRFRAYCIVGRATT